MTTKPTPPADQKTQSDRFIETARALECDEDEAAFKAKLTVIARQRNLNDPPPVPASETYRGYAITPNSSQLEHTWIALITAVDGIPDIAASGIGKTWAQALANARKHIDDARGI